MGGAVYESYPHQFAGSIRKGGTSRYFRDRAGMILRGIPALQ